MPRSFVFNYMHIIYATKHRIEFIDDEIEDKLFAYLAGLCNKRECPALIAGGYRNHVHILCQLSPKIALMDLVEDVKKYSSKWIKTQGPAYQSFQWQRGYTGFSVSPSMVERTKIYIANQKDHHMQKTFEAEYLQILNEYKIEYDEKYIWD